MILIVMLLSYILGCSSSVAIFLLDTKESLLSIGVVASLILKICIGNILLIMRSIYSFIGIVVLFSAITDCFQYKSAMDNISFTAALIYMVTDCFKMYGISFCVTIFIMITLQTFILLWWATFFISFVAISKSIFQIVMYAIAIVLSIHWIKQFFHALLEFVVGGCILWIFVKEENENFNGTNRLLLYLRCGLTTSFGSLCKGALLVSPLQSILTIHHRTYKKSTENSSFCAIICNFRSIISISLRPFLSTARSFHRMIFSLLAIYGRTFRITSEDFLSKHAATLEILVEDSTYFTLQCLSITLSGVIAIVAALVSLRMEKSLWPLYFFMFFYLSHCSASLAIQVYSSAVDALIVASVLNPTKFAQMNQIIFLRFLRTSEAALR
jgi:hypothetical protein